MAIDVSIHHPHRGRFAGIVPRLLVVAACLVCLAPQPVCATDVSEADRLIAEAEANLWFGLAENGRAREFARGLQVLERADEVLQTADMPDADRARLTLRFDALREDLTLNLERSQRKFYGAYPLARLTIPYPMVVRETDRTETFRLPSDLDAVKWATERVVTDILRFQYPHVVLRSDPRNRAFENEAMRVFSQANRPFVHGRGEVIDALSSEDMAAFDRGEIEAGTVARLMEHFGAAKLLVATLRQDVDLPDGTVVALHGTFYEAASGQTTDSFAHMGFSRDRRGQLSTIAWAHIVLLGIVLLVAAVTPWSHTERPPMVQRIVAGVALFAVGRAFAFVAVILLRKIIPDPDGSAAGAAWWPVLVALALILGSGFVAWLAQARLSNIVAGSRTSREVGMIFGMGALGAAAYFIEPLVLLEPDRGVSAFIPFALAGCLLAALAGYAMRTGPPVPRYFLLGPILVTPFVGLALFAVSPGRLWFLVGVSLLLCVAAWLRHLYAVGHGLEEAEFDESEAERTDEEILKQIGKKIEKKLPI
jgi:hypothetical protein